LGSCSLLIAGTLFYAERKREEGQDSAVSSTMEKVLRAESRSIASRLEEVALKADRDALVTAARHRKKPPMRSFLSDTSLAEPDAPKWVIVAGRRIRAAGLLDDALLEDGLEAHLEKKERFALHVSRGKYYLFVKGTLATGQPYASAYAPESFFSAFQAGEGLRVWIAGRDGTVIFHPLHRFIGSNVSNLRPVASGLQRLAAGRSEQFTEKYLGIEGKDALGSWTTLPAQGLLVASEWPREPVNAAGSTLLQRFSLFFGALGFALLGAALGARTAARRQVVAPAPLFDLNRLDDDALEYLESAKASADQAIELAKAQEAEASKARRERSRMAGQSRHLESKLAILESFQDRVLPKITGKQVWAELASMMAESAPGLTIVVYRYSPSSFSLVPEACFDGASLADNALAYLRDARIFIGNPNLLPTVLKTEAFAKWNRTRERHMPLHRTDFRVFPFAAQGSKGALVAVYDERINEDGELDDTFLLMDQLVRRAGTFCDSLTPLLQSSYAKANAGPTLASAPNGAGNRPRPS
jgi:hypothetical protein